MLSIPEECSDRGAMSLAGDLDIINATVISDPRLPPTPEATVHIRTGRVAGISTTEQRLAQGTPENTIEIYDAASRVVVPGFTNCHVHFTASHWAHAPAESAGRVQDELDDMCLSRGFTRVVDLGSDPRVTQALRQRIVSGQLRGPDILLAGMGLYPPKGLPYYVRAHFPPVVRPFLSQPRTPAGARRIIRRSQRFGAQVAKLFTGSYVRPGHIKVMPLPIASAAAEQAHQQERPVFAHTSNAEGLRIALDAGVDVIAHVPDTTDGTVPLLQEAAQHGTWLVPTLDMFATTVSHSAQYLDPIYQALRAFCEADGQLLFGTDVGYYSTYDTRGELAALEHCGLSATEVLIMLTTAPAEALGHGTGTLAQGEPGDVVILDHFRLDQPVQLADVSATIRNGRILWQAQ